MLLLLLLLLLSIALGLASAAGLSELGGSSRAGNRPNPQCLFPCFITSCILHISCNLAAGETRGLGEDSGCCDRADMALNEVGDVAACSVGLVCLSHSSNALCMRVLNEDSLGFWFPDGTSIASNARFAPVPGLSLRPIGTRSPVFRVNDPFCRPS